MHRLSLLRAPDKREPGLVLADGPRDTQEFMPELEQQAA